MGASHPGWMMGAWPRPLWAVPVTLTGLPLQPERDFFGRVVVRRAATLSAGVYGTGVGRGPRVGQE